MKQIFLFSFILFLAACNNQKVQDKKSVADKTTTTTSTNDTSSNQKNKYSLVSIRRAKSKIVEAGNPRRTAAKKPTVFATNTNINVLTRVDSVIVPDELFTATPGKEDYALPTVTPALVYTVTSTQSIPIPATSPRFKDAAISNIQYIDVEQGMRSSFIRSILFDRTGNLWMGTVGAGVSRYDGTSFTNFTEENGLSNNTVLTMMQDKSGKIWFGTEGGGACCYDGKIFTWFTKNEGMSNNTILSIFEDNSGKIWFGTNGDGACCYDGKTITCYTKESGLSNNTVRTIMQDSKGDLWFGTNGWGACKFDGKTFTYIGSGAGLNSKIVHSVIEDNKGNIWLATDDGGVNIYDGKTMKFITKSNGLSSDCVISLHKSKDGTVWMGTYDGGLCSYDGEKIKVFTTRDGLSNNYVLCIREDNAGNIWMGTYGGGICRYDGTSFSHYTEREGLGSNTVRAIVEDSSANVWFGTYGDGAILYNGTSFAHYTENEGLSSNYIKALAVDNNGSVWMGTDGGGAIRFDGKTFDNFTESEGLCSNYILSMYKDRSGKIWFGTDGAGVCSYNGKEFSTFIEDEVLSENSVVAIAQDKFGNIWFGTDGYGACCYDGEFFRWFGSKEGLCSDYIKCIVADRDGNIWFGTDGNGISVLSASTIKTRNPEFTNYADKEGLSSKNIRSLVLDKNDNIWIATEKGLNYLVKKDGKATMHVYTTANGLKANNFFPNSALIDSKNKIWWGNGKALTTLNLNTFKLSTDVPVMQMTSIELEQTFIDFYSLSDSLKTKKEIFVSENIKKNLANMKFNGIANFYNYPENLELPYYLDHVTFHFSAIDWAAPDKIQYQYMLSGGSEKDWSPLINDNKASFSNLTYGKYTFQVRAMGLSQKWSNVFEYSFVIRAPWWQTWWAYTLYVVLLFGAIYLFTRWRTRQLIIQQKKLEHTIEERTAEIVEQKELVEEKQKEIVDSINYAKRIQKALLASDSLFDENLKNYFIFFAPKDIVSGDFYWASHLANGNFALVTADSTGHGVPGAMMSMLNISCLNEAINERKLQDPSQILNHVRNRIIESLSKDGSLEGGKDGMDCSLISFDFKNKKMTHAAANNPIWVVRKPEGGTENDIDIIDLKPDRMPVGKHERDSVSFTQSEFELKKGDMIFALTDGFSDQFGGPKGKKFTYKRLKETLIKNSEKPLAEQRDILHKAIDKWKGTLEQVDDILIIGIKI